MSATRDQQIGQAVRDLRADMSQDALAESMSEMGHDKWSQSTVWSVERGTRPLRLAEAESLARLFNVDVSRLLGDPVERMLIGALDGARASYFRLARAALEFRSHQLGLLETFKMSGHTIDDGFVPVPPSTIAWATLP